MAGWFRRAATAAAILELLWLTGCAGFFIYPGTLTSSTSSSGNYVYVANATTDTLAGFAIGTGTLTAVTNSPYALSFSPTAIAVNPSDTILYISGNSLIYAYAIGTGGVLTALNSGVAVGVANVVAMDISPDGQWLLALDGNGATIDEFQINSTTGVLTQQPGASYVISGATVLPRAVRVSPNGQYVFAALGTAGDLVYPFATASGVLSAPLILPQTSATTSDNALAVSPGSSFLYIARSGTSGGLAVYSIGTGGALSSVAGSPFATGTQPYAVVLNNAGTDVYVANRSDGTISGYSVASSGSLAALTASPYASGSSVTALAAEKTGNYLLAAANGGSPDLTMYSFDAATVGKLDSTATIATGTDPTGAAAIAATH